MGAAAASPSAPTSAVTMLQVLVWSGVACALLVGSALSVWCALSALCEPHRRHPRQGGFERVATTAAAASPKTERAQEHPGGVGGKRYAEVEI